MLCIDKLAQHHAKQEGSEKVHITFHGGEPLLLGHKFYKDIFQHVDELNNKYGKKLFRFAIQTNLTLLSDEYCNIFSKYKVAIGTSIDGPAHIHDPNRFFFNGLGTHSVIMDRINLANDFGIPVSALCLVSKNSLGKHLQIYNFFKEKRINFKTNSLFISGKANENKYDLETTPIEHADFLIKLFDIWYPEKPTILIENLFQIMGLILRNDASGSCARGNCSKEQLTITPDGDCYTCGRTTQIESFKLGNLRKESIDDLMKTDTFSYLAKRAPEHIEECKDCSLSDLCGSGCMHGAFTKYGTIYAPDGNCSVFKLVYRHIAKVILSTIKNKEIHNE